MILLLRFADWLLDLFNYLTLPVDTMATIVPSDLAERYRNGKKNGKE